MINYIGYTALLLNLISMSMKNVLYLRTFSLVANALYVVYGIMIDASPIYIGCAIGVMLHSYWIFKSLNQKNEGNPNWKTIVHSFKKEN